VISDTSVERFVLDPAVSHFSTAARYANHGPYTTEHVFLFFFPCIGKTPSSSRFSPRRMLFGAFHQSSPSSPRHSAPHCLFPRRPSTFWLALIYRSPPTPNNQILYPALLINFPVSRPPALFISLAVRRFPDVPAFPFLFH